MAAVFHNIFPKFVELPILQTMSGKKRKMKTAWKVLLWIAGIWTVLLIVIQIALSPAVLTRLANKYANKYIDGDVAFGEVKMSVFKSFPYLNVGFSDVSVTYPSDRFNFPDENFYSRQGKGETADTLASFKNLYASIDVAALAFGTVKVPGIMLNSPRIFAKSYPDGRANWEIFKTSSDSTDTGTAAEDTAESQMPKIVLGRIMLRNNPHIVYSSPEDTVFAMLNLKKLRFNGRLATGRNGRNRVGFEIDSMFVAGRLPSDTLALKLDRFSVREHRRHIDLDASATTWLAMSSYGRMKVPVDISSEISFPKDSVFAIEVKDLKATVAAIPLEADAYVRYGDRLYVKGTAAINGCKVNDVINYFGKNLWKPAGDISTDAEISMSAAFDGFYDSSTGEIPDITAHIEIPDSWIGNKKVDIRHEIALDTDISGKSDGKLDVRLNDFHIRGKALQIMARGSASDLLGKDPLLDVEAGIDMSLDTLSRYLKKKSGISASGYLTAGVKGQVTLSQLDPYQLAQADLSGKIKTTGLNFMSEKDSLSLYADSLDVWLGAVGNTRDSSITQGERMLALVASVDSTRFSYKNGMLIIGKNLSLKAQNSAAILNAADSSKFYPFGGKLDIGFLSMIGTDTSFVSVAKSSSIFKISPKQGNPKIPVLTLDSSNGGLFLRGPVNRIAVRNLKMDAVAAMNSIERRQKAKAFVDSLSRKYPDIPRDSLFGHLRKMRGARPIPDWLSEKDFMKSDLNLKLSDSMAKYFREWDAEGSLSFSRAHIMSPYFPLRNRLSDVKAGFNNNEIRFDSFNLNSGRSNLSASGRLTGLKRALLGRGFLNLTMDIRSDSLNVNELLGAYTVGAKFVPANTSSASLNIEDEDYMDMIVTDTLAEAEVPAPALLVVPANIMADLSLEAKNVKYSTLDIEKMTTDLTIKERCVQLTNTVANSNIGDIEFEGFYSTRTKQDLKTGFDLALKDITAEKVVEMMPAVDSVMPLLKTFKGMLNCTLSATAELDTTMNIVMPSINGVLRISGDDLTFTESQAFSQIAKTLKFKDRTSGHINHMSVEGLISDNRLEIFPFVLKLDRYTLAMSGIQNLDTSFKYHVSVIDSPIPFRLGIDLSGNFEDFKFRIGKAKYKSADIPVFSSVIDQTRVNLRESIQNIFQHGVDKAVRENEQQKLIEDYKKKIDYRQVVDQQLDSLSTEEKAQIESE